MQGFGGALVAVVGAFYVARWTVHNELKRQDERTRDAIGAEAAGQILMAVASLPEALRRLEDVEPDMNGIPYRYVTTWEANQTELLTQLRLHGMLLPPDVETQATTLAGMLGPNLFDIDVDEGSHLDLARRQSRSRPSGNWGGGGHHAIPSGLPARPCICTPDVARTTRADSGPSLRPRPGRQHCHPGPVEVVRLYWAPIGLSPTIPAARPLWALACWMCRAEARDRNRANRQRSSVLVVGVQDRGRPGPH
jgi:hypothetical protein